MSTYSFKVKINPSEALELVKQNQSADLVHEEVHDLGNNIKIGTLVFEKYFIRVESRVALVVIIDNIYGSTDVRAISTGSSQGFFFKFDWGASENFANSVRDILKDHIIEG